MKNARFLHSNTMKKKKKACPGAGTRSLHILLPTQALLFAQPPSLPLQPFLPPQLPCWFLRDVHASKSEWTVPSSLMRWPEHPVGMEKSLWSTPAHCTPALPLPNQAFKACPYIYDGCFSLVTTEKEISLVFTPKRGFQGHICQLSDT